MLLIRLLVCGLAAMWLAGVASAQSVTIVSGNGQVTCPLCAVSPVSRFNDLVVVVRDAGGNPVPNTTVTWSVAPGPGAIFTDASVASTTTTTDATGRATNQFFQGAPIGVSFATYTQATVTASALGVSAVFTETTTTSEPTTGISYITSPILENPLPGATITGRLGAPADQPLRIRVTTTTGIGVPGVSVELVPPEGTTYETTFGCQETGRGFVLTDSTGVGNCTVVFGGRVGSGSFRARIGGNFAISPTLNFVAQRGTPQVIRLVSGDNQTSSVGTTFPLPFVAVVQDAGGNILDAASVSWTIVSGSGTLINNTTVSDNNGRVSTYVRPNSGGQIQIRVVATENASATYTFTANATLNVSEFQILSGDNQVAAANTPFPSPLVVQVGSQGAPQPNVPVSFAVTSGSATLSSSSATTDSSGRASVSATAGATNGPVTVTATVGGLSRTFNLQVRQPGPQLTTSSFINGASFVRGENALSPCGVAQVSAPGLATGLQGVVTPSNLVGPLPLILAGVTIQMGNSYAPIYNVSNLSGTETVTFQVPCDLPAGNTQVTIRVGTGSGSITVPVQAVSPGVFQFQDTDGRRRAVILRPDGSYASSANPVRRGEIARMYVTGIGPGQPQVATNSPGIPGVTTTAQNSVVVGVNNAGVRVVSTSLAQGLIGVYEVAFEVPGDTAAGSDVPLGFAVSSGGQLIFANGSAIPVQ